MFRSNEFFQNFVHNINVQKTNLKDLNVMWIERNITCLIKILFLIVLLSSYIIDY